MQYDVLYQDLITEFRKRIPQNSKLVAKLADILSLEKEAVYRRLRQEVPFTFREIVTITKNMSISLDNTIGIDMIKRPPCQLQSINYENPDEVDYMMLENYVEVLKAMVFEPQAKMSLVTNLLPQPLYPGFKYINQFYFLKWHYHHSTHHSTKSYRDIFFPERMKKHIAAVFTESRNVKTNHYVLDSRVFQNFVNEVRYFHSIHLLEKEDIANIKADLFRFIDYMETLAINGCFEENKNKVSIYISDLHIDTAYSCVDSQNIKFSMIWAFMFNGVSTYDDKTFEIIRTWVRSIVRASTSISVTGEKQRTLYFEKQRKIISALLPS
jgi:hypothetical protein